MHRSAETAADLIIRFLYEHAGKQFCTGCLSLRLFGGRDIDLPMRYIEGRGIVRQHGKCSECSHKRLVAAVTADMPNYYRAEDPEK